MGHRQQFAIRRTAQCKPSLLGFAVGFVEDRQRERVSQNRRVAAWAKVTPCLAMFVSAFVASHVTSISLPKVFSSGMEEL